MIIVNGSMNLSEEDVRRLGEWRRQKNLTMTRADSQSKKFAGEPARTPNFHFFAYDPATGSVDDLSHVNMKREENADVAVFSIPLSFTNEHATTYKRHDKSEFGFDVRLYLTRNNAPIYPIRK